MKHIFISLCARRILTISSSALAPFQSFCNHKIFLNLNLPLFPEFVRSIKEAAEASQKLFDVSAFKQNMNHSSPGITVGDVNFRKWEHFSGSTDRYLKGPGLYKLKSFKHYYSFFFNL